MHGTSKINMKHSIVCALALPLLVTAQSSCSQISPSGSIVPSVASGYRLQVVATGLSRPRGLAFDSQGHLLVVQAGSGVVSAHALNQNESDGCVNVGSSKNVTPAINLNHGIQLSRDGTTLYASNVGDVYSWTYDAANMSTTNQVQLITNMTGSDHSTRTLQLTQSAPGMLVVSRGSTSNLDYEAADITSGHSQVKAFNLSERGDRVYDFAADGLLLGWGLRNSVGVGEHPTTGGIWTVENSADNIVRDGEQVNQNNPAEEMNFHGYLNGTQYASQGANYGYPWCFTAWAPNELPNSGNLTVGRQFALSQSSDLNNQNETDAFCAQQVPPRLSFQAHMAPLDIKFNNSATEAWISFHGSWNRELPTGYKVSVVEFANGEPTAASDSTTALKDIVTNQDDTACPDHCFRPAGIAIDSQGRVFFSSDASGEVYMVTKSLAGGSGSNSAGSSPPSVGTLQSQPALIACIIPLILAIAFF